MWSTNHIVLNVDLGDTWEHMGIDSGNFAGCGGDCEAAISRHELDPTPGPEVVLKLTQSYNFCRYLVFVRAYSNPAVRVKWKLRGYIDHDFNRYQMSRHRTLSVNGRNFLVVRGQEGSGSGFSLYSETWYQVDHNGVKPVLNYPVEGNTYPWPTGLGRKFKAKPLQAKHGANSVSIRYAVTYTNLNYIKRDFSTLFVNNHRVHYTWSKRSRIFVFNSAQSDITKAEIDAIANIESESETESATKIGNTTFYSPSESRSFVGGGYEVFLKYNSHRLMKIAIGKDAALKLWLQEFLQECEDTTEKEALLQALQKQ